jgi:serine/threonine-protein kinase HipA
LQICEHCRAKAQTRQQLLQWSLFNLLIGNTDDHLKNLSFYAERGSVRLAPFYDLVSTALYEADNQWRQSRLVWPIGHAKTLGAVTRDDIWIFAQSLQVPRRFAQTQLDKMLKQLPHAWNQIYSELSDTPVADGLKKSGELHLLRQFRYGLLQDMITQLA